MNVTMPPATGPPNWPVIVAVRLTVWPWNDGLRLEFTNVAVVAFLTVRVVPALSVPQLAVIVVVPAPVDVARPVRASTVATKGLLLVHASCGTRCVTGSGTADQVPSLVAPSWLYWLAPQHRTVASASTAQLEIAIEPGARDEIPSRPVTSTGVLE